MCTVTYLPTSSGFIFTSNRDEQTKRETIIPKYYVEDDVSLFFPKDEVAGGTWIGLSEKKRLVCLLNGGFVYHNPLLKFPNSRGVVVKKMLKADDVLFAMEQIDLGGVAPFTLLVVDFESKHKLIQLTWCQEKKHIDVLDTKTPKIWSSSTLYTPEMKEKRESWFKNLLLKKANTVNVLEFHQNQNLGDVETSLKMKREVVQTISTTMITSNQDHVDLNYYDYVGEQELTYRDLFAFKKV